MHNQECFTKEGKFLGWFSRSVAVVSIAFLEENGKKYILASQRGKGTPDPEYIGKWNLVCGYLDFDETAEKCVKRETFEETGVDITNAEIKLVSVNTDPKTDKRQNVTLRFLTKLKGSKKGIENQFSHKHNEEDEVGKIKLIDIKDVPNYEWAFGHEKLIEKYLR